MTTLYIARSPHGSYTTYYYGRLMVMVFWESKELENVHVHVIDVPAERADSINRMLWENS